MERMNYGIVGCGMMGQEHIRNIALLTGAEVSAFVEPDPGMAAATQGLVPMAAGNTGVQMAGWFNREINSLADLKGLKMRIPGFAGEVLAKLGAKPTNIAPGELYTALERKTIDALEWVGPSLDLRMGFHKVAPYYYTGWHEPGGALLFIVNKRSWEKLPADLQPVGKAPMKCATPLIIEFEQRGLALDAAMKAEIEGYINPPEDPTADVFLSPSGRFRLNYQTSGADAALVLDADNKVVHSQLVREIGDEPDYDAAIAALG